MAEKRLNDNCSMYEAARLNIADCTVKTAISFYGKKYSFDEVFRRIDLLADNFSAEYGIGKGDVVTLCVPNSPAAVFAFYAVNKLGAIVSLVHPFIPPEKLKESVQKTESKLLVLYDLYPCGKYDFGVPALVSNSGAYMGRAARLYYACTQKKRAKGYTSLEIYLKDRKNPKRLAASFEADEPAVLLASGGTTDEPKTIAHANRVCNRLCAKAQEFLGEKLENYRAMYNVLPIFHGYGLCINMHMCMMMRRTSIMCLKFSAKRSARQIVRERANVLTGVPTMYLKLLAEKSFTEADLSAVKDVFVGGDAVPQKLIDDFNAVLKKGGSNARMYVGYGLTETAGVCVVNTRAHHRENSIGYPLSGTEIGIFRDGKRVLDGEIGEICLHTEQSMLGYFSEEENPFMEAEGKRWLQTGDYGWADSEGYLYFKQRIKNMIKVSGVPVYPCEVEEAALLVKGVQKACAVGADDPIKGQVVRLYVEKEANSDDEALRNEILKTCRKRLIGYAVPKEIVLEEKLPVNLIGKIDRKELEERGGEIVQ